MKTLHVVLIVAGLCLTGCNKQAGPPASSGPQAPTAAKAPDAVQQKLQESSGTGATDCGRLNVQATADQSKAASDCAMQASQGKHPFYVAYDMPGMSVGVAGNASGKLFTVQSQGSGPSAAITSGECPSQLRVASSGRVTCFAPGDMGSMGGSHAGGAMTPGMENPHGTGMENPHTAAPKTK
ncbi:MAG TPA: hypothetical protein VFE61_00100 [Candidatus Sulfotelmatobacter sp.]|jgi:hypothetical protein|nr:hypothetical protein [Candidatus Sulfotelmatobacter sp.]